MTDKIYPLHHTDAEPLYVTIPQEEYDRLCRENKELKERVRWRKFSEELPPHDTWCLVYHEGEIDSDHYIDDCNNHDRFVVYGFYVTHWMPLPEPPEEVNK